jgi:hypothetical protein
MASGRAYFILQKTSAKTDKSVRIIVLIILPFVIIIAKKKENTDETS